VVVIVGEDLGLGWDPSWLQDRIDKIYSEYKRLTTRIVPSGIDGANILVKNVTPDRLAMGVMTG
jgi:hypothetical protein